MFFKSNSKPVEQVSFGRALRHLIVFQLKLAMDALRDFALSPLSILVFLVDAVRKPAVADSLYLRLMIAGRKSDRVINLFDEYTQEGHYTVDKTFADVEEVVAREVSKEKANADAAARRD
jgi:hypothetical protein